MELISPIPRRERRVSSTRIGLLMTGLILAFIALLGGRSIEWFILKQSLRHRFPRVEWITTEQLADWLADKKRQPPVLLDVRTEEEWNVSHLPGARRVDPNASIEQAAGGMPKETPIVTYCAVGYRSGELATKLRAAGFHQRSESRRLDFPVGQRASAIGARGRAGHDGASLQQVVGPAPDR